MAEDFSYFKSFYQQLHPSLYAFALYILHSEADAQEVVNDVFLQIWDKRKRLGPFDEDAAKRLKSYCFQATKNKALNVMRANNKRWMQLDAEVQDDSNPQVELEHKETDEQLQLWLNELPARCKQVFVMSRIDGLPNKDIADLMEISVKTVENQMTKALNFFRKKLNRG